MKQRKEAFLAVPRYAVFEIPLNWLISIVPQFSLFSDFRLRFPLLLATRRRMGSCWNTASAQIFDNIFQFVNSTGSLTVSHRIDQTVNRPIPAPEARENRKSRKVFNKDGAQTGNSWSIKGEVFPAWHSKTRKRGNWAETWYWSW